jgi:hypothetical protein
MLAKRCLSVSVRGALTHIHHDILWRPRNKYLLAIVASPGKTSDFLEWTALPPLGIPTGAKNTFCVSMADEVPIIVADGRCVDELDRWLIVLVGVIDGKKNPFGSHYLNMQSGAVSFTPGVVTSRLFCWAAGGTGCRGAPLGQRNPTRPSEVASRTHQTVPAIAYALSTGSFKIAVFPDREQCFEPLSNPAAALHTQLESSGS